MLFLLIPLLYSEAVAYPLSTNDTTAMTVTVDTFCNSFHVCVTDNKAVGIKRVVLLNDPYGEQVQPPSGKPGYEYKNVMFSPELNPDKDNSLVFVANTFNVCFDIYSTADNYLGYAPVYIQNAIGDWLLVELGLERTSFLQKFYPGADSIVFFGTLFKGEFKDTQYTFVNQLTFPRRDLYISRLEMEKENSSFDILSVSMNIPDTLYSGDTLRFRVRFNSNDTNDHYDNILLTKGCTMRFPVFGTGNSGLIYANDHDFGTVFIDTTKCTDTVRVKNVGLQPLIVNRDFYISDTKTVTFNPDIIHGKSKTLPVELLSGEEIMLRVCYSPQFEQNDSIELWLSTNIREPFRLQTKHVMNLRGKGLMKKVVWDRKQLFVKGDSTQQSIISVFLNNIQPSSQFVNKVYLQGSAMQEFSIINSESTLSNFVLSAEDADWFTISFKPDMTKPLAERYADRHATLVAELADSNVTMELIGTFNPLHVKHEFALDNISFSPNPVYGQDATLSFTLAEPKQLAISIYDILGREVISIPSQYYPGGSYSNVIGTSKLSDGSYILLVSDGVLTKSISFRVVK